jgi:hypothetical protein
MAKQHLSHAEVWDDSALVTSWNEALAEYKKYNSMAAKGEKVEVILDQAENDDPIDEDEASTGAAETEEVDRVAEPKANGVTSRESATEEPATDAAPTVQAPTFPGAAAVPQALMGRGKCPRYLKFLNERNAELFRSSRRRPEEHYDELVLRWLLHWLLRGPAESPCGHATERGLSTGLLERAKNPPGLSKPNRGRPPRQAVTRMANCAAVQFSCVALYRGDHSRGSKWKEITAIGRTLRLRK